MKEKINCLEAVREDIGEKTFKFSLTKIIIKHYTEVLKLKEMKLSRESMLSIVNLKLIAHGAEEVSYGYLRKVGY